MLRKILVVDDAEINRKILSKILCDEYEVMEAANGREALEILNRDAESISAVLLDIEMPEMDGFEVLSIMQHDKLMANIPVIVASMNTESATELKTLALGAVDFILKPYNSALIKHRVRNIIKMRENAAIANLVKFDELTGLYNRAGFFEKAAELIYAHEPGHYVIACFDIDNFKVINDQYGSDKGDEVLRFVAQAFIDGLELVGGISCRIMADHFALLYPSTFLETKEIDEISRKATALDGSILPITASVGRYIVDDLSLSVSAMYDRAALAERSVKGRYDTHIAMYDESMRTRLLREQEVVNEMRAALENDNFEMWLQPQYNHSSGALIGAEALVRWNHPFKGMILPSDFIPVFERNGFIYELDKYIWEQACIKLRKWIDEGHSPVPIAVNISRYDLLCEDLMDVITGLMNKYALPIELLRLEITESAFADATGEITRIVRELIAYGFTVEIDDFGAGYSSLNTLKDIPAEVLKLDMRFLEDDKNLQRGGNIIESVVRMAKWIGMSVIAEGVETNAQADYLKSIGCVYVQGYLYAQPMPVSKYEELALSADKEEKMLALETVENLDNSSFWDPKSMDTLIFNSYVGGACIYEYHDGKTEVLRVNEQYVQIMGNGGLSMEEALKIDFQDYMDEASVKAKYDNIRQAIATGKESSCEIRLYDLPYHDGVRYYRATVRAIAKAGSRVLIYNSIMDITALREAEEKEHEVSEHLQAIMQNVNGGISALAMIDDGPWRYIFTNDQYCAMFGYTPEQFTAEVSGVSHIVHPDDRQRTGDIAKGILRSGRSSTYECRCIKRDGSIITVRCNSSATSMARISDKVLLSVVTDVTELALAQQIAAQSSAQLQTVIENINGGVAAVTIDDDMRVQYLLTNKMYYSMLGYTKAQFDAEVASAFDVVHPDDREEVIRQTHEGNKSNKPFACVFRAISRDGRMIWIQSNISMTTFIGVDSPVQLSVASDITALREAEWQIAETSQRLQAIMDSVDSGITAATFTSEEKINIIFSNDRYYEILGYTGQEYHQAFPNGLGPMSPKDRPWVLPLLHDALHKDEPITLEYRVIHKSGQEIWVRQRVSNTEIAGIDGVIQLSVISDVTKEKEAELKKRMMAERLRAIVNNINNGITAVTFDDNNEAEYVFATDRYYELLGYTREQHEAERTNPFSSVHPEDVGFVAAKVAEVYRTGETAELEFRAIRRDGQEIWLRISVSMVSFLNVDKPVQLSVYTDISEAKRIESDLRAMNAKIESDAKEMLGLMNDTPGGFVRMQMFTDGTIIPIYVNDGLCDIVGMTYDEVMEKYGESAMWGVHPEDLEIVNSFVDEMINYGESRGKRYRLCHGRGGYAWVMVFGRMARNNTGEAFFNVYYASPSEREKDELSVRETIPFVLRAIMESSSDIAFAKDKDFKYLCCSRAFAQMAGFDNERDIIGKTDYDLFTREVADKFRGDDMRLFEEGKSIVDMVELLPSINGVPRYSSTSKYLLRDSVGNIVGLYGVGRDITDYRTVFEQIKLLTDHVPGGLAAYKCSPRGIEMVYFNDGYCRLVECTREEYQEIVAVNTTSMVHPEDVHIILDSLNKLMRDNKPGECTYRMRLRDGSVKWVNLRGTLSERNGDTAIINVALFDVTEAKKAEDHLRMSEEQFRLALLHGGNIMCRYDVADKSVNMTAETAAVFSMPEKVTDVPYEPVRLGNIAPESVDAYIGFYEGILHGNKNGNATFRSMTVNGWRWLKANYTTIFSDDGNPVYAVISMNDVTEQQDREAAYKQ